jgi:selenocysteine-specific elongation factor
VAVNLTGASVEDVQRGDVLAGADSGLAATYLIDAELSFGGAEPEHGDRVTVHHGTREAPARLGWLGGRFWQLRLERPLVPAPGDRLVIRQIAPPDTLGGGTVLDAHPRKHGPSRDALARLQRLAHGQPPAPAPDRDGATAQPDANDAAAPRNPEGAPAQPDAQGDAEPQERAAPLTPGAQRLAEVLLAAGVQPPLDSELDPGDLAALRAAGIAVRVSKTLHYHRDVLGDVRRRVIELAARGDGSVTLAGLRDELNTSRKFAQALLEHLDATKVTLRRGDAHVVRAGALRDSS